MLIAEMFNLFSQSTRNTVYAFSQPGSFAFCNGVIDERLAHMPVFFDITTAPCQVFSCIVPALQFMSDLIPGRKRFFLICAEPYLRGTVHHRILRKAPCVRAREIPGRNLCFLASIPAESSLKIKQPETGFRKGSIAALIK